MKILCAVLMLASLSLHAQKKGIVPPEFAAGTAPYTPGILVDSTLYISGQIGQDLKTAKIPEDFAQEVKLCLDRVGMVLKAAGMTYNDAVSVQIYLTDMGQFAAMNAVYTSVFKSTPLPARTTVGVSKLALPNAHIEITVTARK